MHEESHITELLLKRIDKLNEDVAEVKIGMAKLTTIAENTQKTLDRVTTNQTDDSKRIGDLESKYSKAMGGVGVILALGVGWVLNFFKQIIHNQ